MWAGWDPSRYDGLCPQVTSLPICDVGHLPRSVGVSNSTDHSHNTSHKNDFLILMFISDSLNGSSMFFLYAKDSHKHLPSCPPTVEISFQLSLLFPSYTERTFTESISLPSFIYTLDPSDLTHIGHASDSPFPMYWKQSFFLLVLFRDISSRMTFLGHFLEDDI